MGLAARSECSFIAVRTWQWAMPLGTVIVGGQSLGKRSAMQWAFHGFSPCVWEVCLWRCIENLLLCRPRERDAVVQEGVSMPTCGLH